MVVVEDDVVAGEDEETVGLGLVGEDGILLLKTVGENLIFLAKHILVQVQTLGVPCCQ